MQHEESLITRVFAKDRDSVTSFACQMIVHDCALISSVSFAFPHSMHYCHSHMSAFAWCDRSKKNVSVRGWKIFCSFVLWLQSALAQCS